MLRLPHRRRHFAFVLKLYATNRIVIDNLAKWDKMNYAFRTTSENEKMTTIKVKHVASKDQWKEPKDGCGTWIEYWKKHSGFQLKNTCRDCRLPITQDNPFVGAHVKKVDDIDDSIYIVPTCKRCNTQGAFDLHEFECDPRILVPANKDNL